MNASDLLRVKQLFLQASDLPLAERTAFLDRQEGLDLATRQRIDRQLRLLADEGDDARAEEAQQPMFSPSVRQFELPDPDAIGPYRVIRRIGEGGMGIVFFCQQAEPVRRQVAVKLIRAGLDSAAMLQRSGCCSQTLLPSQESMRILWTIDP